MTALSQRDGTATAQHYLQQAPALRLELLAAMDAIGRNSLPDFEQSLWQQEMLSTGMRRNLQLLRVQQVQPSLMADMRAVNASLQQVSRVYQGVIDQASQSANILRGVCTLYGQAPSHTPGKQQSLQCEA